MTSVKCLIIGQWCCCYDQLYLWHALYRIVLHSLHSAPLWFLYWLLKLILAFILNWPISLFSASPLLLSLSLSIASFHPFSSSLLISSPFLYLYLLISSHPSYSPCLFSSHLSSSHCPPLLLSLSPLNLSLALISRDIRNGLTLVSRAHQLVMDGFNWSHSMNVVTIFRYMYSTVLLRSVV